MADSGVPSKPRMLLSILKSSCFEHLEGEPLFTAITAGYGRFECTRLLKPSGVELANLPPAANIEISVCRRTQSDKQGPQEKERQKQLLYHGLIALSTLQPILFASPGADTGDQAAPGAEGSSDPPPMWEGWLGLRSSDVNLKAQEPELVFQRCLELGSSGARFPRLFIRLQYLPPGASAASAAAAAGARSLPPAPAVTPASGLEAPPGRRRTADGTLTGKDAATPGSQQGLFYKPVKIDPVDCMLAAALLRLDEPPPVQIARLESGKYILGPTGPRFRCSLSGGRVVAQPLLEGEAAAGVGEGPVELDVLLRSLASAAA